MPRAVPKIAIFEEAARTLDIPGGTKIIQEYYRQMRKFGCNILAVIQQYDIIKESAVRGAMIGNSNELPKLKSAFFSGKSFFDCQSFALVNLTISFAKSIACSVAGLHVQSALRVIPASSPYSAVTLGQSSAR